MTNTDLNETQTEAVVEENTTTEASVVLLEEKANEVYKDFFGYEMPNSTVHRSTLAEFTEYLRHLPHVLRRRL